MHIIPERPPDLQSAPPLDLGLSGFFLGWFCLYFDNCAYYVKRFKKCWWIHEFTRHFFSKLKGSVFLFSGISWLFTVVTLLAENSKPAFFLHLHCVAVRLYLMCVFIACTSVHTLWNIMSGRWVMYPFYYYHSLMMGNMILCVYGKLGQ